MAPSSQQPQQTKQSPSDPSSSYRDAYYPSSISPSDEGFFGRTKRKFGENPFVPIGLAAAFLGIARMFTTLHRRDAAGFQNAQRLRVGAQLFATMCLVGGIYYSDLQKSKAEEEYALSQLPASPNPSK